MRQCALRRLRHHFRTFAFADAHRTPELKTDVVDLEHPPGADESAAINALLTAVCRPSLWLAPGLLCTGATVTGAGTGKGKLVRTICAIAMGLRPQAMPPGHNADETDKRLVAAYIDARPVVFLDNVNGATLKSDTIASALTERPATFRVLGKSETVSVTAAAFTVVTGNGLLISEDLARRFLNCTFDGGENAENRDFDGFPDPVDEGFNRRTELLSAALTIWRWGRQMSSLGVLPTGKPIGSFEQWSSWVRDPLLALGCRDPAERIADAKARDPERAIISYLFAAWWHAHKDQPMEVARLDCAVRDVLDPTGRMPRQWLANRVAKLANTRADGFVIRCLPKTGRWPATRYQVVKEDPGSGGGGCPMTPMTPMPYDPLSPVFEDCSEQ